MLEKRAALPVQRVHISMIIGGNACRIIHSIRPLLHHLRQVDQQQQPMTLVHVPTVITPRAVDLDFQGTLVANRV